MKMVEGPRWSAGQIKFVATRMRGNRNTSAFVKLPKLGYICIDLRHGPGMVAEMLVSSSLSTILLRFRENQVCRRGPKSTSKSNINKVCCAMAVALFIFQNFYFHSTIPEGAEYFIYVE